MVTVAAESQDPGTPIIVAGQRPGTENFDDQLWFFEPVSGVLRSALNGFCFDMDGRWSNRSVLLSECSHICKLRDCDSTCGIKQRKAMTV